MHNDDLARWFDAEKTLLETAYVAAEQPWQQSGFGLHTPRDAEQWAAHRRVIAYAVDRSGSFLDIGCANGYLLECVLQWTAQCGFTLDPYGLDISERLIALARQRLPAHAAHLFIGNAWDWTPLRTFDFVRTELVYVPDTLYREFISRLLDRYLAPGGSLLLAEYRMHGDDAPPLSIDRQAADLGFPAARVLSVSWQGSERTRLAVIEKP